MIRYVLPVVCAFFFAACSCEPDPDPDGDGGPGGDAGPILDGCGDGNIDTGETCDDRNLTSGDGCSDECLIEPGYTCDTPGVVCRLCGNGTKEPGEVCDDGNVADDGCNATCTGTNPGYTCWEDNVPCELCGDSVIDLHETCDDGDADAGDGCSDTCQTEPGYHCDLPGLPCLVCGDGTIDAFETCDDGNATAGDGCSPSCKVEAGWDCNGSTCSAAACGDGFRAGAEECDDGGRTSGDGCSYRCTVEPGYLCITEGIPCRAAVCNNSTVEAQETCDDGNTTPGDGCSATCRIETGYACPTPGSPCTATTCGNGTIEGIETCDDGNATGGDGCSSTCLLEVGAGPTYYACPSPGQPCIPTTCGNGQRQGSEPCDDGNTTSGDGCSATCTVEPFFECAGNAPSVCKKPIEFVRIAVFPAPMAQPQAVHYDPQSQSFIAYGFDQNQGLQEFCLDGTKVPNTRMRNRNAIGNSLDGAAYDPFTDHFLFVQQSGQFTELDRNYGLVRQVMLTGLGTAGGIQVGDDGRIYATNHYDKKIYIFDRNATTWTNPVGSIQTDAGNPLDNIFVIPGMGWVGYYNLPPVALGTAQMFTFHKYDGALVGRSHIPGTLFANGQTFPANADGGEAAVDGGYFLVCSEYLNMPSTNSGICQLFSRRCTTDLDCANRVPGTSCNTAAAIPYCHAPARARDDFFTVGLGSTANVLDVLANDQESQAVCEGGTSSVDSVTTPGSRGGTITVSNGGADVTYTPGASFCGSTETFSYTADLVGEEDDATVTVFVACVCGNGAKEPGEACDDGNTTAGDGCSPTCRFEAGCPNGRVDPGEQCDDGNVFAGDGCSPTCIFEME